MKNILRCSLSFFSSQKSSLFSCSCVGLVSFQQFLLIYLLLTSKCMFWAESPPVASYLKIQCLSHSFCSHSRFCLSEIISVHIQQLPDLVTQLGVLYHMIESRVRMFHKLTKLHGKLYLLMTQVRLVVHGTTRWHSPPGQSVLIGWTKMLLLLWIGWLKKKISAVCGPGYFWHWW